MAHPSRVVFETRADFELEGWLSTATGRTVALGERTAGGALRWVVDLAPGRYVLHLESPRAEGRYEFLSVLAPAGWSPDLSGF